MISYCDDCGEYLGDYVNGVLFKFGQRVIELHLCPGVDYRELKNGGEWGCDECEKWERRGFE